MTEKYIKLAILLGKVQDSLNYIINEEELIDETNIYRWLQDTRECILIRLGEAQHDQQ